MNHEEQLRLTALDRAIAADTGKVYDEMALDNVDPNKILEAAKKFEAYLKGKNNDN